MVVVVKRRPWLALVVLVLIGINATMLVHAGRSNRTDDELAATFDTDFALEPCEVVALAPAPRTAIVVDETPLTQALVRCEPIIALAPKTSPPR